MKVVQLGATLASLYAAPVCAQSYITPPEISLVDENGVDLLSGSAATSIELGSIGNGISELAYSWHFQQGGGRDSLMADLYQYVGDLDGRTYVILSDKNTAKRFTRDWNGSVYTVDRGHFEKLEESADGKTFTYTRKDGQIDIFGIPPSLSGTGLCATNSPKPCNLLLLQQTLPNGVKYSYEWEFAPGCCVYTYYKRPTSVTSNLGYKISLFYPSPYPSNYNDTSWSSPSRVDFINLSAGSAPIYSAYMSGTVRSSGNVTTTGGENWYVAVNAETGVSQMKSPSSGSVNWSFPGAVRPSDLYVHASHAISANLTTNGVTHNYHNATNSTEGVLTVTAPNGAITKIRSARYSSRLGSAAFVKSITDPLNNVTTVDNIKGYLITTITHPEGNKEIYSYDSRDNITSVTYRSKPNSGLPDITESADYPPSCSNPVTCNRPTVTRDKKGNGTEYSYSPDHGGVLTETGPSDLNGIRPVIRSSYAQKYAWISNGAGGYQQAASPVWLRSEERTCRTTATVGNACAGGSGDEVVTTFEYGPNSGPNNLNLRGVVVTAGGVSQRTCYAYDAAGRKISETQPSANQTSCP